MKRTVWIQLGIAALAVSTGVWGQDEHISVPFSDPSGAHKLVVNGTNGTVTVKGYSGKEVTVDSVSKGTAPARRPGAPPPPGMKRLGPAGGVVVMEENNVIQVRPAMRETDLTIQVPANTSVNVTSMRGAIVIDGVRGEMEASNMSGPVTITNASGSVVAHSMRGKITANLDRVATDKPTSFSTFNGDVDVTLPANTKANLKFKTFRGDVFSDNDFDVKLTTEATKEKQGGHVIYNGSGTRSGTINGGGPEIQFTTFNGRILLHKK